MRKYAMEFVGTCVFVFTILMVTQSPSMITAVIIGLTLMVVVYMGGAVSGSHYNPAVTLGLRFANKISSRDSFFYIVAQLLGALVAYWLVTRGLNITLSAPVLSTIGTSIFLAETIFTFVLVTTVFHVAVSKATAGNSYYGLAIGGVIVAGATAVGGISGGFFNPAVMFGVGLTGGLPTSAWITMLFAQIVAAFVAASFFRWTQK